MSKTEAELEAVAAEVDYEDAVVAAGGVLVALTRGGVSAAFDLDAKGELTNRVIVRMGFMSTAYRLTVERMPDDD